MLRSPVAVELVRLGRRFLASRLPPACLGLGLALVLAARLTAGGSPDPEYDRAAILSQVNEAVEIGLWLAVLVGAWLTIKPDHDEGFTAVDPPLGAAGFTLTRIAAAAGWLLVAAAVLAAAVELATLDLGRAGPELLHLAVIAANRVPFLLLLLVLGAVLHPVVAWLPALLVLSFGQSAAWDRVALADRLIDDGIFVHWEVQLRWLLPPPLVDALTGDLLRTRSQALNQFPIQQGPGIWGADLVAVSGSADVLQWGLYVAGLAAVLWLVSRRRAAWVRRRVPLPPLHAYEKLPDHLT